MSQINADDNVSQTKKTLRTEITIYFEKYPDGEILCYSSNEFIDGPIFTGDDAKKLTELISEQLGIEVFFDADKLQY